MTLKRLRQAAKRCHQDGKDVESSRALKKVMFIHMGQYVCNILMMDRTTSRYFTIFVTSCTMQCAPAPIHTVDLPVEDTVQSSVSQEQPEVGMSERGELLSLELK